MPKVQKMKDAMTRKCSLEPNEEQFQVISPHFQKLGRGGGRKGNVQKITKLSFFQISQEITLWKSCTTFKKFLIVNKIKIKTKKLRN